MQSATGKALEGLRVLDLSRILAGPYCTMILGDQGAEVIKVERPGTRRRHAHLGTAVRRRRERLLPLLQPQQEVDHHRPEEAARASSWSGSWPEVSDVLVENFTPGLMKRFGLDYETLRELNPRLVYCSITAYGQDGPYRDRPGYDMVLSAVGGLMWITGERDGNPCKVGVAITDVLTGVYAVGGDHVRAALARALRPGPVPRLQPARRPGRRRWPTSPATTWWPARRPRAGARPTSRSSPTRSSRPGTGRSPSPWPTRSCGSTSARCSAREEWLDDPRFESNPKRVENRERPAAAGRARLLAARPATSGWSSWSAPRSPAGRSTTWSICSPTRRCGTAT